MTRRVLAYSLLTISLAWSATACEHGIIGTDEPLGETETIVGAVKVRVLEGPTSSTMQYVLFHGEGERIILDFEPDSPLRRGDVVEVVGRRTAYSTFRVSSMDVRRINFRRSSGPIQRERMHHRVAFLAVSGASVNQSQAFNAMNGSVDSTQHYFNEISHGIDTFSGEVFRAYDISYSNNDCKFNNTDVIAERLVDAFERDGHNRRDYDHIATIVPKSCGSDWSGAWAYIGGMGSDGKPEFEQISMYKDNAFDPWYLAHEIGHNLGLNHARSIDCGSSLYRPNGNGCSFDEYGNHNDVMGWGEGVTFGAAYQRYLGWAGATNIVTAGKNGVFNLQPADGPMCGTRAVRVPIPSESGNYFYVEYRRARSDSRYAGTGNFGGSRGDAVLITRSNDSGGSNDSSYTDRVELGTSKYAGADEGRRYDLGRGVSVRVRYMGGDYVQVEIETPESDGHRDDNGNAVFVASDGSIGRMSCDGGDDDLCPDDPNKTEPGECGCGVPEGTCGDDGGGDNTTTVFQAEDNTGFSGCKFKANHAGYKGRGFMDYGGNDTWIEWNNVQVAKAGRFDLTFRYANGRSANRQAALTINGTKAGNITFASTGAWNRWGTETTTVSLRAGKNTIRVRANTGAGGPNLDQMEVKGDGGGVVDNCPDDPNKTEPGECGCGVPEGTCSGTPYIEMSKSTYAVGETIVVRFYNLPGNRFDWVGTFDAGDAHTAYLDYVYSDGAASGTMRFAGRDAGRYDARLFFNDSYTLEHEVSFTVEEESGDNCPDDPDKTEPGICGCGTPDTDTDGDRTADCIDGCPRDPNKTAPGECGCGQAEGTCGGSAYIEMSKSTYEVGETIVVHFFGLPGNRTDWVGTFNAGTAHNAYLDYVYSGGAPDGTMVFVGRAAGRYNARLFFNDSYNLEYEVSFTVEETEVHNCPGDPNKTEPGICGCGTPDTDSDRDGTPDCNDRCPGDPDKTAPGDCGCGVPEDSCGGGDDAYIEMSKETYAVGETIVVRFHNLPGNRTDWVGTFRAGDAHTAYLDYLYSGGAPDGTMELAGRAAGRYDARLFFNDSYTLEYEVSFTVEGGDDPPGDTTVNCTLNPYADVNWSTFGQHKANFHTHTTESDGDHSPSRVIDQYHDAGYTILAITDHDTLTWPWTSYGRDPDDLGMVAVRGDEYSRSHHMNAFWDFSTTRSTLENGIPHVQSRGGLCQINHPGRYSSPSDWAWYVDWYRDYPACVGLEVINRAIKYPEDRALWDNINESLFESQGRFVWGFSNDDKHSTGDLYRAFQFMLLPALDDAQVRASQEDGTFYFCSEPGGSGRARVPRFSNITVDNATKEIRLNASDYNSIKWIGPGTTVVDRGDTFDFSTYNEPFVRAVAEGSNGECYTQPFGFEVARD